MVLLEAASNRGDPARGIDGRSVWAAHLLEQNGFRALLRSFQRRAHPGKARTHHDDVVHLVLFLRVRLLGLGFHRTDRGGHRGARRKSRLQKVSAFQTHEGLLSYLGKSRSGPLGFKSFHTGQPRRRALGFVVSERIQLENMRELLRKQVGSFPERIFPVSQRKSPQKGGWRNG
jgi:hypothetical protein